MVEGVLARRMIRVAVAACLSVAAVLAVVVIVLAPSAAEAACELNEQREGSGFENWELLGLDRVRDLASNQGYEIERVVGEPSARVSSGTVVRVSRCTGSMSDRRLVVTVSSG